MVGGKAVEIGRGILALFPFLVRGSLAISVLREMRRRGAKITIAFYQTGIEGLYTRDALDDFRQSDDLLDLTKLDDRSNLEALVRRCESHEVGLVLQIGAPAAYHQLPELRQRCPRVRVLDTLYNPVGHAVNHFLYERVFDGAIVESQAMKRFYAQNSQRTDPVVHLVESGIDLNDFSPVSRPERYLTVGYVGRLSPEKNPVGFIRMVEAVQERFSEMRFRIFGEGIMQAEVRSLVDASPAREVLQFEGYAEHATQAFGSIDVLVVPSILDGRPNVIMEANACGLPVIAAPVGGIPELIEEGVNGALIGPRDHDGFAGVLGAWAQPGELDRLRVSSRALAERRFDRARMMNEYQRVLERYTGYLPR